MYPVSSAFAPLKVSAVAIPVTTIPLLAAVTTPAKLAVPATVKRLLLGLYLIPASVLTVSAAADTLSSATNVRN